MNGYQELPSYRLAISSYDNVSDLTVSFVNSVLEHVPQLVFASLPNVTVIRMVATQTRIIDQNAFQGMDRISAIMIAENPLVTLPQNIFRGLIKLRTLKLIDLGLETIAPEWFLDLHRLNYLTISKNPVRTLEANVFEHCPKIWSLDLVANAIESLPETVFDSLSDVESIKLDHNRLQDVHDNLFANTGDLRVLTLSNNSLTLVSPILLRNLSQLEELHLRWNYIEEFQLLFFPSIKPFSLDLRNNRFTSFNQTMLTVLENLDSIWLNDNRITSIAPDTFREAVNTTLIELDDNYLEELPVELLAGLTHLRVFAASNNKIKAVPEELFLENLEVEQIRLSNNLIEKLPPKFFAELPILLELYLDHNNLVELREDAFADCPKLRLIRLGHNHLTSLPEHIFEQQRESMQLLDAKANRFSSIGFVKGLKHLIRLDLEATMLERVEGDEFEGFANLTHLMLGYNQLVRLADDSFQEMYKLKLSATVMQNVPMLQEFDLSNNPIAVIDDHFLHHHSSLERVSLNDFNASSLIAPTVDLTTDGMILPTLTSLDLSGNGLNAVPIEFLRPHEITNAAERKANDGKQENIIYSTVEQ
uniref:Uncharacterized protein n=1 Tax=Anopheles dirus TaxID=7168 RepID=A0A182NV19_9DIPT